MGVLITSKLEDLFARLLNYMTLPPSLEMKIEKKDDNNLSMTEIMEIIFSLEC